jgi:tagatose 1,6-diphosphate aldolase
MARAALARAGEEREPTHDEIVAAKLTLVRHLGKRVSAVLLDAVYGAWHAVCSFRLPASTGLIVRLERADPGPTADGVGRVNAVETGWSVAKIKRMGADAVKLMVYYEPDHVESAQPQRRLVEHVAEQCDAHDIVLLLEALSYPLAGEEKTSPSYLARKPRTVVESARHLSGLCDVYKAEFPGTLGHDPDDALARSLAALDEACRRPWVLLSAGVDFPDYHKQVAMACEHGASGILGGRAIWKELFECGDDAERTSFLRSEAAGRLAALDAIVKKHARPWFKKYRLTRGRFARVPIPETWHRDYSGGPAHAPEPPAGPAAAATGDD